MAVAYKRYRTRALSTIRPFEVTQRTPPGEEEFRQALIAALDAADLPQTVVADRCGVSAQTITNLKNGKSGPQFSTVRGLVDGLGMDPWLALGLEPPAAEVATVAAPEDDASEILSDLVAAGETLRARGNDLVDAWRRAEAFVKRRTSG